MFINRLAQPQNYFRIEGPGIGIGSPDRSTTPWISADNCIDTKKFTLSGVDVPRETYTQNVGDSGLIDDFATSDDTPQTINVAGTGIDPTLLQSRIAQYFARVRFIGSRLPSTITVTNLNNNPQSIKELAPEDFIAASANYDTDTRDLTIVATSSDSIGTASLSIEDFGIRELVILPDGTFRRTFYLPHPI